MNYNSPVTIWTRGNTPVETAMYNTLSSDYDRFVNWQNRLSSELPFIIEKLRTSHARDILDAATGTGMHAIALAQLGYQVSGADISTGMIQQARKNATSAGVPVRLETVGFGALEHTFDNQTFDALLCLGNSLPHLLSLPELAAALKDFAACLRPGGLLLVQNRNFDVVMAQHDRWMEPQSHREEDAEWIYQRFYDFDPDGLLTFNMVTLKRIGQANWSQQVLTSRLRPLLKDELISSLTDAGFVNLTSFGNMAGAAIDPGTSPNLVVLAHHS
jgi:SAM-dependent methyltransferase